MDSMNDIRENMTIILIAHRLSTVKKCDKIFLFENGKLKNEGTFKELMNGDESFRKNANINHKNDQ